MGCGGAPGCGVGVGPAAQPWFCLPSTVPWQTAESAWRNGHLPKKDVLFLICRGASNGLTLAPVPVEYRRGGHCPEEVESAWLWGAWYVWYLKRGSPANFCKPFKGQLQGRKFPGAWGQVDVSTPVSPSQAHLCQHCLPPVPPFLHESVGCFREETSLPWLVPDTVYESKGG